MNILDLGFFPGGSVIEMHVSGSINIMPPGSPGNAQWLTSPAGVVLNQISTQNPYKYANVGATNYPTDFGGDGMNHFVGCGANYDYGVGDFGHFGFCGAMTTDTTAAGTIRFGAVVGTFSASPARGDWFYIGDSATINVPTGGADQFLAVADSKTSDNSGAFTGTFTTPEPATAGAIPLGACLLLRRKSSRIRA